jgi:hypothetical protein
MRGNLSAAGQNSWESTVYFLFFAFSGDVEPLEAKL